MRCSDSCEGSDFLRHPFYINYHVARIQATHTMAYDMNFTKRSSVEYLTDLITQLSCS